MKIPWKTYLDNSKRIYSSIFEQRNIDVIIQDYYNKKWISKSELEKLFEYEKKELVNLVLNSKKDYDDLLSSFNLNAMRNYEILEEKFQGITKI